MCLCLLPLVCSTLDFWFFEDGAEGHEFVQRFPRVAGGGELCVFKRLRKSESVSFAIGVKVRAGDAFSVRVYMYAAFSQVETCKGDVGAFDPQLI